MKKIKLIFVLFLINSLISCGGSESYRGKWKAMDVKGRKFEITFTENKVSIKDSLGNSKTNNYVQKSVAHEGSSNNFADTYEIQLDNGERYQIFFPKDDQSFGVIRFENPEDAFSISKKNYLTVDQVSKK